MKPYAALVSKLISNELLNLRTQKALTQENMAEHLRITSRAYSDLEHGKYCPSASTLLFFLSMLESNDQLAFLHQFITCASIVDDGEVA